MSMSNLRRLNILVAEDNPQDILLLRRAFDQQNLDYEIRVAKDGDEAMSILGQAERGDVDIDLMLVDLNLPCHNGDQIVILARSGTRLKKTPIILLSSSDSPRDRARVLESGANLYVQKPSDLHAYMRVGEVVKTLMMGDVQARQAAS
jgi:two-component system, chemotaxis family, response regulator Rcp1